ARHSGAGCAAPGTVAEALRSGAQQLGARELPGVPAALVADAAHPLARGRDEPGFLRARTRAAEDLRIEHRGAGGVLGVAHRLVTDESDLCLAGEGREGLGRLVAGERGPGRAIAHQRLDG